MFCALFGLDSGPEPLFQHQNDTFYIGVLLFKLDKGVIGEGFRGGRESGVLLVLLTPYLGAK